ncbi:MAG: hypothetical protein JOZ65_08665 [Chloroflexi bacterium]|nr:hypothetical protein [Chloroflexota bacterium]
MADSHGLAHDDATTRAELIALLARRLSNADYLREQIQALLPAERRILESAHASGGELRTLLVDAEQPGATEDLVARGWVFRTFAAAGPLRGEVLVVPDEMLAALPPPHDEAALRIEDEAPPEPRWTDPAFSLFALISALTRGGGNLEAEVRDWSQEPGGWAWDARWSFLQHLVTSAGLLVHRPDGVLTPAPQLPRLLDDRSAIGDRLWRTYLHEHASSELSQAGISADADLVDAGALRQSIVDVAMGLPAARWLRFEALSSWLSRVRPRLVREQLTPRGLIRFQSAGWDELEQPLLRYFFLGPLYWLGLVAAGRDGTTLSRRRQPDEPRPAPCHWDGAVDLVAPATAHLGTLQQAERYLVLRKRDRISRYHLVQTHVAAALGAGGSIAECRELLSQLTQAPLPPVVAERLQAWDQRFGVLAIRPAVVLEARSPEDLDVVLDADSIRPLVRARLGPAAAEVAASEALELAAALRALDYLPRIDAALRLAAEPRRAYAGLVDEQVLEFLLVSLLAFRAAWPDRLSDLEGSTTLLERLEHQFPPARLAELRAAAQRLAGTLTSTRVTPRRKVRRPKRKL